MEKLKRMSILLIIFSLVIGLFQFGVALGAPSAELLFEIDMAELEGKSVVWGRSNRISPDNKYVAVGTRNTPASEPSPVFIFDIETGEKIWRMEMEEQTYTLGWSPDGKYLVMGITNGQIKILDVDSLEIVQTLHEHVNTEWVVFSPDSKYLYSYGRPEVIIWDTSNWEIVEHKGAGAMSGNAILDVSPDGTRLAVITGEVEQDMVVEIWDAATLEKLGVMEPRRNIPPTMQILRLRDVMWSPDGSIVAAGGANGVMFWDAEDFSSIHEISFPVISGQIYGVAWSPEGSYIAVGCNTNDVFVFDTETYEKVWEYPVGTTVLSVDWSSDGNYITAGNSGENHIRSWRWLGGH